MRPAPPGCEEALAASSGATPSGRRASALNGPQRPTTSPHRPQCTIASSSRVSGSAMDGLPQAEQANTIDTGVPQETGLFSSSHGSGVNTG